MSEKNTSIVQNDEIDLIELLFSIWKHKWWIVIFTAVFAFVSVGYALLAPEEWTSRAEIVQPEVSDIGFYLDRYKQYISIAEPDRNKGFDNLSKILEFTFDGFVGASGSYENHFKYFKQSIPGLSSSKLAGLIRSIKIEKPNVKKGIKYLTISFSAADAKTAQKHLEGLISHINQAVYVRSLSSLNAEILAKVRSLTIELESIKKFTDEAQEIRLKNLHKALRIASAAGIKKYSTNNGRIVVPGGEASIRLTDNRLADDNFLFMLGTDYLQAQIDTLKTSEIIYPERYYQAKLQARLLKALLNKKNDGEFKTFSYQSSPSLPLQRSKPRRALIVLLGTLAGMVLGTLAALLVSALQSRKQETHVY